MKMKTTKIIGLVLIFAGAAILITGIVQFTQFNGTIVGKLSGVMSDITGSRTDQQMKYIITMIVGAICAVMGIVIVAKK
jgi:drug/metabolite transporter (DMT)-like permease